VANAFLGGFALMFSMHTKPWNVRNPGSKQYIGIGAFNLVRAGAYRAMGGHSAIAMRPDDDLKLGKLVKHHGFRSDFVNGTQLLRVEWYASFSDMRNGLMKNMFAVLEYNPVLALLACAALFLIFVWPVIALLVTSGVLRWMNVAVVLSALLAFALNSSFVRIRPWWCLTLPLAGLVTIYFIVRSAWLTLRNRGIDWRGTHYSLERLRANRF
jgi:hypothetical protein